MSSDGKEGRLPEWQKRVLAATIDAPKKRSWWRRMLLFIVGFFRFLGVISWPIRVIFKGLADDVLVLVGIRKRVGSKTAWRWKDLP